MNTLLVDAVVIIEKARKSVDRQNEVSKVIEAEFFYFSDEINGKFNELYNRICKIKKDYKHRIKFLENMCQHYTDNLSHRINAFAFDEKEIRQKLSKLEWDLISLQCVGRLLIEASASYLSEISFDKIEKTLHKRMKYLTTVDSILADQYYNLPVAPDLPSSPAPILVPGKTVYDNKFTEVLRLVYESMRNFQRLPHKLKGMTDAECMNQNNLMDEASKLLTMCINIQQKITNAHSIDKTERNSANSSTDALSLGNDGIINSSDSNSNQSR